MQSSLGGNFALESWGRLGARAAFWPLRLWEHHSCMARRIRPQSRDAPLVFHIFIRAPTARSDHSPQFLVWLLVPSAAAFHACFGGMDLTKAVWTTKGLER